MNRKRSLFAKSEAEISDLVSRYQTGLEFCSLSACSLVWEETFGAAGYDPGKQPPQLTYGPEIHRTRCNLESDWPVWLLHGRISGKFAQRLRSICRGNEHRGKLNRFKQRQ